MILMDGSYDAKVSSMLRVSRFFAIISIVSAHITSLSEYKVWSDIYAKIGSTGVICFLFIAGYYYKKYDFAVLVKKKFVSVIIPWLFCGTVAYFFPYIISSRLSEISAVKYFEWLIGYKTYLYYVTVILLCFLIFYSHSKTVIILSLIITPVSVWLTSVKALEPLTAKLHITEYLNVFNWIGFFGLGMLVREIPSEKFYSFIKKTRLAVIPAWCVIFALSVALNVKFGYFGLKGIAFELISVWFVFCLSSFEVFNIKPVRFISDASYPVYLLHMSVMLLVSRVYDISFPTRCLSNIILVCATAFVLWLGLKISELIHIKKAYTLLTGMRVK